MVDYFTTLTPKQVALYEECLKANLESLETLDRESREQEAAGDRLHAAQARLSRRGQILRMILNLKQISNSPSQFKRNLSINPTPARLKRSLSSYAAAASLGGRPLSLPSSAKWANAWFDGLKMLRAASPNFSMAACPRPSAWKW